MYAVEILTRRHDLRRKNASILIALPLLLLFFANACHHAGAPAAPNIPAPRAAAPLPPVKSPSGKVYARTRVGPADNDEPVIIPLVPPGAAPSPDNYHGTARKAAKLSVGTASPKTFPDLGAVMDSLRPDADMRAMNISKEADSARLPEEQTVVIVKAFLYAASKESDNDFHCIVGTNPGSNVRFMNVEVSGLPARNAQSFTVLKKARDEFKSFFTSGGEALPTGGYEKYDPPIPIQVTGSVFFDVDHVPPAVGPTGMKPLTAWEIHPVSDIQFEPQT